MSSVSSPLYLLTQVNYVFSGIEHTLEKHTSGSSGAFSGKGQTLGGGTAAAQPEMPGLPAGLANLDPQLKIFLLLIVGYIVFWYLST